MSKDEQGHNPLVVKGDLANAVFRGCSLPNVVLAGIQAEDFGFPDNVAPGAKLDGARIIRFTAARTSMRGSSMVGAETKRANFQKTDLGPNGDTVTNGAGWDATGAFFEEGTITDMAVDGDTKFHGAHLQETRRGGVDFHSEHLVGADFGPSGPGKGQPRQASRITAATKARAVQTLGDS